MLPVLAGRACIAKEATCPEEQETAIEPEVSREILLRKARLRMTELSNSLPARIELREYSPQDFEQLWELDQRCFTPEIAYSRRELSHYLGRKTAICLIAERSGRLAGFIVGQADPRGFGHVITLDIDPDERKLGIGSTLMQTLEQRFLAASCKSILLEVAVNNREGLSFYKKHGYSVLKVLRHYYPGDLDGMLMGKRLQRSQSH